jgi:hypothetical protein
MTTIRNVFLVACLVLAPAFAQTPATWQTATEFPGLDQSGLSAQQKQTLLTLIRAQSCSCGCTCILRMPREDPKCGVSRGLSHVGRLRGGTARPSAPISNAARKAPPVLDEAVKISIEGDRSKVRPNARITLVRFPISWPYCAAAIGHLYEVMAKPLTFAWCSSNFLDTFERARHRTPARPRAGQVWSIHDKLYSTRDLT